MKRLMALAGTAIALGLVAGAGTASAANGPAQCGALNMLNSAAMNDQVNGPMAKDNPNGNAGMFIAVGRSCR
jgi:hypothetical protein